MGLVAAILPPNNRAPTVKEIEKVRRSPKPIGTGACVNDCVLFLRVHPVNGLERSLERLDLVTQCPRCDEPRYVENTTRERRIFWHFSLVDLFRIRFANRDFAKAVVRQPRRTDGVVEV